MKHDVYLALGSNLGDREKNLAQAIDMLSDIKDVKLKAVSGIYETEPVGYTEQGKFLNAAVRVSTGIDPFQLLKCTQGIEAALKRVREIRWGPRTLDIDILLYDDLTINAPELTIPHASMFERAFVLIPLSEILDEQKAMQLNIDTLILKCDDRDSVRLYSSKVR